MPNKLTGKRIGDNFNKRFGDRINMVFADKPVKSEEKQMQNKDIYKAINKVLTGILKREPTAKEILGFEDISKKSQNK